MKIILGLVKPASGSVRLAGETISGLPTPQIVRRGVGSVPEARRLFGDMSVRENLPNGRLHAQGPARHCRGSRPGAVAVPQAP